MKTLWFLVWGYDYPLVFFGPETLVLPQAFPSFFNAAALPQQKVLHLILSPWTRRPIDRLILKAYLKMYFLHLYNGIIHVKIDQLVRFLLVNKYGHKR